MTIEWVEIEKLKLHPKNPNKHSDEQIERLSEIIRYQGWRHPIIVEEGTNLIYAGNGRYMAARKMGLTKVPVHFQTFQSEEQAYAFLVSDNAIASWAELDLALINVDLPELGPDFDIDLLGIQDFVLEPADKYEDKDADETPEVKDGPTICQPGDLWQLGEHRLLCGDSTKREDIERLMNGENADMVFTDPPYNVNFKYNQYDDTKVDYWKWKETCEGWLAAWKELATNIILTPGANNLELWCRISEPTHIGCWIKENANTTGRITHLWKWEPIIFIGKFPRKRASDVFTHHVMSGFLREPETGNHPCPKPVALWEDIIDNFSEANSILFEPFCGSGTTVIACEKTGRRCFGIEIDPAYADIIIARWEKFTGQKAVKIE